jgi:8-oxo-dGTP pyrophosphatase MutT (NUDIX family)
VTLTVEKVVAYIVRGDDLLVLAHRDLPLQRVGLQVPAGTLRPGEDPAAGVLREAQEETGLDGLALVSHLGDADYDVRPGRDEVHRRHFFHLAAPPSASSDPWTWFEQHDGHAPPTAFSLFWIPITHGHVLCAGFGALLSRLPSSLP